MLKRLKHAGAVLVVVAFALVLVTAYVVALPVLYLCVVFNAIAGRSSLIPQWVMVFESTTNRLLRWLQDIKNDITTT